MYFEIVRSVLDGWIPRYASQEELTIKKVHKLIRKQITTTSTKHRQPNPDIDYGNPLCRLGYLFVHAGANATLFQWSLRRCKTLRKLLSKKEGKDLCIAAVGGGPGTELLGLYKHFGYRLVIPRRVTFLLLDQVPQWGETWASLADHSERWLASNLDDPDEDEESAQEPPILNRQFHPLDAFSRKSYQDYSYLFETVDLFVFNYLLSESQDRLEDFSEALELVVERAKEGAVFLFLDRWERRGSTFKADVEQLVADSGLECEPAFSFDGAMDEGESRLGSYPTLFEYHPRRWFQTYNDHLPTVFGIVATKP